MTNIFAGIIFYEDTVPILSRCFESCKNVGLKIIAVDGAFSCYSHKENHSTDGCMEYARANADVFTASPKDGWYDEWGGQCAKRSSIFETVHEQFKTESNYVFIIDADETIEGDFIEKDTLIDDVYNLNFVEYKGHVVTGATTRVYKVYPDMFYKYKHRYIYRKSRMTIPSDPRSGLILRTLDTGFVKDINGNDMVIRHFPMERNRERILKDAEFIMNRTEKDFCIQEFPDPKRLVPPKDATDYYEQWVRVQYLGSEEYNGHLINRAKKGDVFEIPRGQLLRLQQDFGTINWKEVLK